jgi:hypothetical protein
MDIFTDEIQSWNRTKGFTWPVFLEASNDIKAQSLAQKTGGQGAGGGGTFGGKTIKFYRPGVARLTFDWKGEQLCGYKIMIDGVEYASRRGNNDGEDYEEPDVWHTVVYDVPVKAQSEVAIQITTFDSGQYAYLRNLYVSSDTLKYQKQTNL